jgi:molybdate transport system substrate-binding protein
VKRRLCSSMLLAAVAVAGVLGVGAGSAAAASKPTFNVFAAASLYKAFPAMVAPFKAKYPQYNNFKFNFNFQGSPTLVSQIEAGAPADLFAGASTGSANSLLTDSGGPWITTPRLFCQNTLCVIVPASNPAHIDTSTPSVGLGQLDKSGVQIAVGDAATKVPIGVYTQTVLNNISGTVSAPGPYGVDYATEVNGNVVATEANVNLITAEVAFGAVDAGFVYNSDKVAAGAKVIRMAIARRYQSNPLPTYPIAVVKASGVQGTKPVLAARFIAFAMSARGQKILLKWGFLAKPYPIMKSIAPTSGTVASTVTIKGTNFGSSGKVRFGTTVAATTVWSPTSITATVPEGLAAGKTKVTVTSDSRTSRNHVIFTVVTT